jgi:hypothetical protein
VRAALACVPPFEEDTHHEAAPPQAKNFMRRGIEEIVDPAATDAVYM